MLLIFWQCCVACGILVPWSGIEPRPSTVRAWSPNHWTAREFPGHTLKKKKQQLIQTKQLTEHTNPLESRIILKIKISKRYEKLTRLALPHMQQVKMLRRQGLKQGKGLQRKRAGQGMREAWGAAERRLGERFRHCLPVQVKPSYRLLHVQKWSL